MAFCCDVCGEVQAKGTKPVRVVLESRPTTYPQRKYRRGKKTITDPGGTGREVVSEANSCGGCHAQGLV